MNIKKELIDQPLHVLMGGGLAFIVAWGCSLLVPLVVAMFLGAVASRFTWSLREWWQHKDHDHEPRYWWSFDLAFIDAGILIGLIVVWTIS